MDREWSADRVGAYASFACAVHCLLSSIALGVMSVVGLGFLGSAIVDVIFITLAVSIGSFAVWSGHNKHKSWLPAALFLTGLTMVAVSHFVIGHTHLEAQPHDKTLLDIVSDTMAVIGGLTLVSFHFVNARMIKKSACSCPACRSTPAPPKS